jgi:hypothetical protein
MGQRTRTTIGEERSGFDESSGGAVAEYIHKGPLSKDERGRPGTALSVRGKRGNGEHLAVGEGGSLTPALSPEGPREQEHTGGDV